MAAANGRKVIAVMQPYFAAYPGYYRLLAAADLFVIYDCVQFPRRGWVHRNRAPDAKGEPAWLTLPMQPAAFDARIDTLTFADDAAARVLERLPAFPSLAKLSGDAGRFLNPPGMTGLLVDYLHAQLAQVAAALPRPPAMLRSSGLHLPADLRGEARILEICRRVGATDYVNAPGGRELYAETTFADAGMRLHFLPPWEGSMLSILHDLTTRPMAAIAADVAAATPDYRA